MAPEGAALAVRGVCSGQPPAVDSAASVWLSSGAMIGFCQQIFPAASTSTSPQHDLAQKTRRQVAPRACKKRSLGVIAPNRVALFLWVLARVG